MARTLTVSKRLNLGSVDGNIVEADITSYATGGESIKASELGLESTGTPDVFAISTQTNDVLFRHDRANDKLLAIVASTGLEVAAATAVGKLRLLAIATQRGG